VIWSVPVAGLILIWLGRTNDLRVAMGNPRMLAMGALTAALIVCNWGIYVWAVQHGFALDAALGYYINPLVSIGVGAIVLREPLNRLQVLAIALAALAVAVLTWEAGTLPVLALGMTLSWAAYAFAKKQLPIGPNQGFMLEVLILLPVAIGYVIWAQMTGNARFMAGHPVDTVLLACAGVVTAIPLILYANGAKLLRLSTIAILQYVSPTLIFLVAVFVFGEPFGTAKMIAFPLIWAALIVYSAGMFRQRRA
jgi:chloramphenicol-sensitive protein RarD